MEISEIKDSQSVERWLKDKPPEWAQVLSARLALRIVPLAWAVVALPEEQPAGKHRKLLSLLAFRASFISSTASKYPAENMESAAAAATATRYTAQGAALAASTDIYAAVAAAYATSATTAATDTAASAAADTAAFSADAAANAAKSAATAATYYSIWSSIRADAEYLEWFSGQLHDAPGQARHLMEEPLWMELDQDGVPQQASAPDEISRAFQKFCNSDIVLKTGFGLIADWYREALKGKSAFGEAADIKIAQLPAMVWGDEEDEPDPVTVMEHVAELVGWERENGNSGDAEHASDQVISPASLPTALLQEYSAIVPYGALPTPAGDFFEFGFQSEPDDLTVANRLHDNGRAELALEKASELAQLAHRVENQRAWANMGSVASKIAEWLSSEPERMSKRIALAWDLSVTIGTYIELDEKIAQNGNMSPDDPLDFDIRRSLDDLNSTLSTIIREFPTGEKEDEKHKSWNESEELLQAAKDLFEEVKSNQLLVTEHMELLALALQSANLNNPQGAKNAAWGSGTMQKLLAVSAVCASVAAGGFFGGFTGEIGAEAARKTGLSKKSADFIRSAPEKIENLLKHAPGDVRAAHKKIIQELPRNF